MAEVLAIGQRHHPSSELLLLVFRVVSGIAAHKSSLAKEAWLPTPHNAPWRVLILLCDHPTILP